MICRPSPSRAGSPLDLVLALTTYILCSHSFSMMRLCGSHACSFQPRSTQACRRQLLHCRSQCFAHAALPLLATFFPLPWPRMSPIAIHDIHSPHPRPSSRNHNRSAELCVSLFGCRGPSRSGGVCSCNMPMTDAYVRAACRRRPSIN
ncbi:hypothetical protein DAEQUDRAFT_263562 [Daedalea quercina L-15889]|uniref:Uncharacterized protein n=1 Tax=Daedalea quercina L-15889 TaxID=1314783 RepID=A0A165QFC5_9APHY|nr:hypothetical protein DAEQUDRAFT_263562 [Daedalea quercina L-15889]